MKVTILDGEDFCWSAFVILDDKHNALVILYAAPGTNVSATQMAEIRNAYDDATREFAECSPAPWRVK
jgi:hypothetical protein